MLSAFIIFIFIVFNLHSFVLFSFANASVLFVIRVTGPADLLTQEGPILPMVPANPPAQPPPTVPRTPAQGNTLLLLLVVVVVLLTRDTVRLGRSMMEARVPILLPLPANTRDLQPLPGPPRYITDSSLTAR